MFIEKETYYEIEEFKKYGIVAVYTKKNAGNFSDYCGVSNDQDENRKKLLSTLKKNDKIVVMAHQTHSSNVINISNKVNKYTYENVDGFITNRKDIAIFTFYADCLPIFVYDTKNDVIGVFHSGWQGTYGEMMESGIKKMKLEYDTDEENIILALGIGISQKDYEVGEDFYLKFANKFGENDLKVKKSFLFDGSISKYRFDNTMFNYLMALELGILEKNIVISEENTYDEKFHSYRRDKTNSGRATAMITF